VLTLDLKITDYQTHPLQIHVGWMDVMVTMPRMNASLQIYTKCLKFCKKITQKLLII